MMNKYIVTADRIGFINEGQPEERQTFDIPAAGIATYRDLMTQILDLWNERKIKIDNDGRVSGCQVFFNGRMVRNLNAPLNTNLTTVAVTLVRAMSGG